MRRRPRISIFHGNFYAKLFVKERKHNGFSLRSLSRHSTLIRPLSPARTSASPAISATPPTQPNPNDPCANLFYFNVPFGSCQNYLVDQGPDLVPRLLANSPVEALLEESDSDN
jgi:hypothetical protein